MRLDPIYPPEERRSQINHKTVASHKTPENGFSMNINQSLYCTASMMDIGSAINATVPRVRCDMIDLEMVEMSYKS